MAPAEIWHQPGLTTVDAMLVMSDDTKIESRILVGVCKPFSLLLFCCKIDEERNFNLVNSSTWRCTVLDGSFKYKLKYDGIGLPCLRV